MLSMLHAFSQVLTPTCEVRGAGPAFTDGHGKAG